MVGTRYVMSCTLLLLGMYVADCAVCRSHTRTHRGLYVYLCILNMFQVSHKAHPTQPKHGFFFVVVCLFVVYRLFSCCCMYVVVYFRHRKGKPGRVSKGGKGRGK